MLWRTFYMINSSTTQLFLSFDLFLWATVGTVLKVTPYCPQANPTHFVSTCEHIFEVN